MRHVHQTLIILNPSAHSTRAGEQAQLIASLAGHATMVVTTGAGDAQRLAADAVAQGYHTVVAAGGDGTINEVVNGLAGSDVALGILPVGTMNVFASELGLPSRVREAWQVILAGKTREVDLARANGQHFVQLAGVGLDAQVVKETSWDMKRRLGPVAYVVSAAQIAARKPPRLRVEADGRTEEGTFVLIGNGRYYGGRMEFFRDALIDDGLLDVLIFQRMSYLDIARYLATMLIGRHTSLSDVVYFQAKEIHVTCDEAVPVEVDGELSTELPVTFSLAPKKLRVLIP